jgi:LuxR family maltose regulon positive regulatory protein
MTRAKEASQTIPLLSTKFHAPLEQSRSRRGGQSLVPRDRLLKQLHHHAGCRLILLSAPAGFGKTTLLGDWVHQAGLPFGWLSLDAEDDQPDRFWTYVVGALQMAHNGIGESTLAMLHSPDPIPLETCLIPLINELADLPDDLLLILDDYHVITHQAIHNALIFLLDHLPPSLHLAIASRIDPPLPLARLRVRRQLAELRAADLRFTNAEAAVFFDRSIKVSLTDEHIATIQAKTEGWIAGLQLAALSMRSIDNLSTFIDSIKGTQKYILDYLIEEVLQHQSRSLQTFLLRTSILNQMCQPLCDVVVNDAFIKKEYSLEQLEQNNLFIVPLDSDRQWYRYHHLFQDLLQHQLHRLEPEQVTECHHRAAQWYEQHDLITEALHHAIAAQAFDWATNLIEREIQLTNPRFESAALVLNCLDAMPPELVWSRPWLLLAYAWVLYSSSQFAAAATAVERLEQLLHQADCTPPNSEKLWGIITAFKGMQARQQGAMAESVSLMELALQQLPPEDSWLRAMILLNLGVTYFVADEFALAARLLPDVARIGRIRGMADPAIAGLYLQGQFLALRGRIDEAIAFCQQGFDLAKERGWLATYAGVLVQVALADLLRERNQLEAAAHHLTAGIHRGLQTRQPGVMMGYITLARVRLAQGDRHAAWEALRAADQCQPWLWSTMLSVSACRARLALAEGDLDTAIAWVEQSGLHIDGELHYSTTEQHPIGSELDYLTLARVLIARGRSTASDRSQQQSDDRSANLDRAMHLLKRLEQFATAGERSARVMEVLILQALVWQARGDRARAVEVLHQAVRLPHQAGYIRLFVDEGPPMLQLLHYAASHGLELRRVRDLLSAFEQDEPNSAQADVQTLIPAASKTAVSPHQPLAEPLSDALIEPLSDRELEVLQHLATGQPNQAIADRLIVSLATVKWHARNIYGKLNVRNRTQAVAKARALGILDR